MWLIAFVDAIFCQDWLAIVKHLKLKGTLNFRYVVEIFASFKKADTDSGHDVVTGVVLYFFFEYDAVFPGLVIIREFDRLRANYLIKLEILYVCLHLYLELPFICIIGKIAFYQQNVTWVSFWEG